MAVNLSTQSINLNSWTAAGDGTLHGLTPSGNNSPTGSITATGLAFVGYSLTASSSLADADGLGTFSYQWQDSTDNVSFSNIVGATNQQYTIQVGDSSNYLRCIVSYTDGWGNSETATSASKGPVSSATQLWKGIPNPDSAWATGDPLTDTAPADPVSWPTAETAGYYYVDNSHPSATDANTYGYPNVPRLTYPTTLAAGDVVTIGGGTYTGSDQALDVSGTSGSPVWFRGASYASPPIIRRDIRIGGTYAYFENLKFDTNRKTIRVNSTYAAKTTNNICIRNCILEGPATNSGNTAAIGISGTATYQSSNIVIYNNIIHDFGDRFDTAENDYHGLLPGEYCNSVWILNNSVYYMGGDSIQIGQATYTAANRPYDIYVAGNSFHDNKENAIDVKSSAYVYLSENDCYGFYGSPSSTKGEAIVIHDGADHVYTMFSEIHDSVTGYQCTNGTNCWAIGNIIYNIEHLASDTGWDPNSGYSTGAAIHFRGSSGGAVNNTCYTYDTGIQLTTGSGYVASNNIFSNRNEATSCEIRVASSTLRTGSDLDYNVYYNSVAVRLQDEGTTYRTLANWQSTYTGSMDNCVSGNPNFTNASTQDFSLGTGSAAIDTGNEPAIYAAYETLTGIDIREDYVGTARPTTATDWDTGAYEKV